MEINYDKLVVECIPEIDKSTKYLENALIDSNKTTDIANRYSNKMRRVINRCIEDTKNISDKMDNLGLYINKKVYDFIQIMYGTTNNPNKYLSPILIQEWEKIKQREKIRRLSQNEGISKNNDMSLDECLKLATEEYEKNGYSDEFRRIISQNKNWYWYETLDGKRIKPCSSQYEYYQKTGKYMKFKMTEQAYKLYELLEGDSGEFGEPALEQFANSLLLSYEDNNCDIFFKNGFDGYYGTDQGMFKNGYDSKDGFEHFDNYYNAKDFLVDEYGMSEKDAKKTLKYLDSIGACSYAAAANQILYAFKDKPDEFQKTFGYPMYKEGTGLLNEELLLADLFVYSNSDIIFNVSSKINSNRERKTTLMKNVFSYEIEKNEERRNY